MYKILLDGLSLYDSFIKDLKIFNPKLSLEQNGLSSFEFTIYPTHPLYNKAFPLKSLVEVYQRDSLIFRGRVFELEASTQNAKKIYCEDELAFLCDSIQTPYNHSGSVREFFNKIIETHNEQVEEFKRFKVGTIDSFEQNDLIVRSESDYFSTWETIKKKLFDVTGGFLKVRHESDGVYLDYLADFTTLNAQEIEFGANMLTVKRTEDNGDIATVLIPLGAVKEQTSPSQPTSEPTQPETVTQERLTIADVNGGKIYIENAENIKKFGRIVKVKTWDDIKDANTLKTKGIQVLEEMGKQVSTVEITAIDLANIKKDIYNFRMGSKIKVKSAFHGLDDYFVPMKMSISLFKPANNKITLNGKAPTLSGSYASDKAYITNLGDSIKNVSTTVNENFNLGGFKYKPDSGGLSFVQKGTSNVIFDVHSSGKGMAFGKPSEAENTLDIGWSVKYKTDREWTPLTITGNFKAFDTTSTPEFRVRDRTVEIRGVISPLTAHTGSDTLEDITALPAELAPSKRIDVVCQGDQRATWMLTIQPDGKLQFSKYGKANFVSVPTTARLAFHTTYLI